MANVGPFARGFLVLRVKLPGIRPMFVDAATYAPHETTYKQQAPPDLPTLPNLPVPTIITSFPRVSILVGNF